MHDKVSAAGPAVVTLSALFPSAAQPQAGLFIRERMFRVARHLPLTVVSPVPWFPLQALVRRLRPHFRPMPPRREVQQGIEILRPRFLSVPAVLKQFDGLFMAIACLPTLRKLRGEGRLDLLDAHFAYPDGYAASMLGRWLDVRVTVTLRGTEPRHARMLTLRRLVTRALMRAERVFTVASSLKHLAVSLGVPEERVRVVGNGVDIARFSPLPRDQARGALGVGGDAPVLISVGGLVERKGIHRVIDCLGKLRVRHPSLIYLVVGGPCPEGDMTAHLRDQVRRLGLGDCVRFLGPMSPSDLSMPLSAADVFVLATRNEGWANVFLEAMACGLPIVTTDVGGNKEVVSSAELGTVVPFGDGPALVEALDAALVRRWDRETIRAYAAANTWESRVALLVQEFRDLMGYKSGCASAASHCLGTSIPSQLG